MTVAERPTVHVLDALRALRDKRRGVAGGAFRSTGGLENLDRNTTDSRASDDDPFGGPKLITDPAAYGAKVLDGLLRELGELDPKCGHRNHSAHKAGQVVGRHVGAKLILDAGGALNDVIDACRRNGLVDDDGLKTVQDSVASGYQWGLEHPVAWEQAPTSGPATVTAETVLAAPPSPDGDTALLDAEVRAQRIRRDARRLLDSEEAAARLKAAGPGYTWGEFVALDFPDIPWLVDDLAPRGGNVTLTAPFKTGKTTTIGELVIALATRTPFLGLYHTALSGDDVVAVWDYEMTPQLHQGWSRKLDHHLSDGQRARVYLRHLRGAGLKLDTERGVDEAVDWLAARRVGVWVLDPFARAYLGDENDNGAVTRWTDTLDVIKERAGVHTLFMPVHTGRRESLPGGERARGATRLDDWPDVRWLLTKDEDGGRYFRASGRDVEVEEAGVKMLDDRRLVVDGGGRKDAETRRGFEAAYKALPVYVEGAAGMSLSALAAELGKNHGATKSLVAAMRKTTPPLVKVVERNRGSRTEVELWKFRHFDETGLPDPFGQSG